MNIFFSFVLLASMGFLALGLLSPKFLKPLVRVIWSRARIAAVFGAALMFSFVGVGITAPPAPEEAPQAIITEDADAELKVQIQQEESADGVVPVVDGVSSQVEGEDETETIVEAESMDAEDDTSITTPPAPPDTAVGTTTTSTNSISPSSDVTTSDTAPSATDVDTTTSTAADTYINVDGQTVESPSANPDGATGVCKDGTYTHAVNHQGACSSHGGVAYWLPI